jgi:hypothetical protein
MIHIATFDHTDDHKHTKLNGVLMGFIETHLTEVHAFKQADPKVYTVTEDTLGLSTTDLLDKIGKSCALYMKQSNKDPLTFFSGRKSQRTVTKTCPNLDGLMQRLEEWLYSLPVIHNFDFVYPKDGQLRGQAAKVNGQLTERAKTEHQLGIVDNTYETPIFAAIALPGSGTLSKNYGTNKCYFDKDYLRKCNATMYGWDSLSSRNKTLYWHKKPNSTELLEYRQENMLHVYYMRMINSIRQQVFDKQGQLATADWIRCAVYVTLSMRALLDPDCGQWHAQLESIESSHSTSASEVTVPEYCTKWMHQIRAIYIPKHLGSQVAFVDILPFDFIEASEREGLETVFGPPQSDFTIIGLIEVHIPPGFKMADAASKIAIDLSKKNKKTNKKRKDLINTLTKDQRWQHNEETGYVIFSRKS